MATQGVEFIKLCGATGPNGSLPPDQKVLMDRLALNLAAASWDQLDRARRMIQQMREGISYEEIETEIQQGRVSIEPNRTVVRQFEPTTGAAQQAAPGLWPSRGLYPELGVRIRQPQDQGMAGLAALPIGHGPRTTDFRGGDRTAQKGLAYLDGVAHETG